MASDATRTGLPSPSPLTLAIIRVGRLWSGADGDKDDDELEDAGGSGSGSGSGSGGEQRARPSSTAVGVRGESIVVIGTDSQVMQLADSSTRIVDAKGKGMLCKQLCRSCADVYVALGKKVDVMLLCACVVLCRARRCL